MKPLLTFLVLLGTVAILADDGAVPSPSGTAPRFQIVTGYTSQPVTGAQKQTTFRLDTWTGETWQMDNMPFVDGNGRASGGFDMWVRIQEINGDLHQHASRLLEKNAQRK